MSNKIWNLFSQQKDSLGFGELEQLGDDVGTIFGEQIAPETQAAAEVPRAIVRWEIDDGSGKPG